MTDQLWASPVLIVVVLQVVTANLTGWRSCCVGTCQHGSGPGEGQLLWCHLPPNSKGNRQITGGLVRWDILALKQHFVMTQLSVVCLGLNGGPHTEWEHPREMLSLGSVEGFSPVNKGLSFFTAAECCSLWQSLGCFQTIRRSWPSLVKCLQIICWHDYNIIECWEAPERKPAS